MRDGSLGNTRSAVAVAVLMLLTQGCTVGPDFTPPKPDVPARWTGAAPGVTPTPMRTAWWSSFDDPTLTALIERAAKSNLDLRQAALRIVEARAQREVSAAAQWPSLSGNASYTRERISEKTAMTSLLGSFGAPTGGTGAAAPGGVAGAIPGLKNPFDQFQYGFDASWEVDLFGRVRRSVEAADADTAAAVEDGRDMLVTLSGDVARTYIDLRATQRRRAILAENLASQREIRDLTRDRQRAGLGNDLDVANASAQVTSTEAQIPSVDAEVTLDINQLSFLLGLQPGALGAELDTARPVPPVPPDVPIGLPADLARRRPDIRRAEAQLHAATARTGVAVASLFPRLTLNLGSGFQAERVADLAAWAARFLTLGPNLELPIFDGGQRRATVRLQDAKAEEATIAYARTVLAALHDVDNALNSYDTERRRRTALEATVASARDALALARQRYASGLTSFLDVLDAERSVQQAELTLNDGTKAVSTDLVALYKALGGGWEIKAAANDQPHTSVAPPSTTITWPVLKPSRIK